MSLASICKQVAILSGVAAFDSWADNQDTSAIETVAWVNQAQDVIAREHDWRALVTAGTVVIAGTGLEESFALPANLDRLIPDSAWLQRSHEPAGNPCDPADWQRVLVEPLTRRLVWTLEGDGSLRVRSSLGDTFAYRYFASHADYTTDAQVSSLGARLEPLIQLLAVALYRDSKGLPGGYAAAAYPAALAKAISDDLPIGALAMGRRRQGLELRAAKDPGTFILSGGGRLT